MKKIILSVVVMACFLSQINAQVKFGIKGGVNFDSFKYKDAKSNTMTGWQAGVLLQVKVPVIGIGIQPEAIYTARIQEQLGGKNQKINYLEIPVNLQWGPSLPLLHPFLMAGPYFAYAVNIKSDALKNTMKNFDWGIGLGAGLDIWKLQFAARYTWGLQNVSSVKDFEQKNNSFKISLGFLF